VDEFDKLLDIPLDIAFVGERGKPGLSAYQVWLKAGNKGSVKQFLTSLKGKDGDSIKGDKGDPGLSAYEVWKAQGNEGTEKQFIASLKGQPGKDGVTTTIIKEVKVKPLKGDKGDKGDTGQSAYELWLENNEGTEEDFLKSLKGKDASTPIYSGNAYTELKEQSDVSIISPADQDILRYNATTKKWYNTTLTSSSTFTRTAYPFTAQTSITINHNQGFYPSVTVLDSDGYKINPAGEQHISVNAFIITFTSSATGTIVYDANT